MTIFFVSFKTYTTMHNILNCLLFLGANVSQKQLCHWKESGMDGLCMELTQTIPHYVLTKEKATGTVHGSSAKKRARNAEIQWCLANVQQHSSESRYQNACFQVYADESRPRNIKTKLRNALQVYVKVLQSVNSPRQRNTLSLCADPRSQ